MESFYERQRYYAGPIAFINRMILGAPPLIAIILALIPLGIIESNSFYFPGYIAATLCLVAIPILKLFSLRPKLHLELISLFLYPATGAIILLSVTGFQSPLLVFWLILLILGYANFGLYGYLFNSAMLLAIGFVDLFFHGGNDFSYFMLTFFYIFYINAVGLIIANALQLTARSKQTLEATQNKAGQQRDRLKTLINSMAEGMLSVGKDGIIHIQNAKMLEILDTNQSLVGKRITDVLDLIDTNGQPVPVDRLLEETTINTVRTDLLHKLSPRERINLNIQISAVRAGFHGDSSEGYVIIISDTTKRKNLEDERDEFISIVSHELRTPVAVAEGSMSNLLVMEEKGMNRQRTMAAARTAHQQVLYLAKMINDLGTLSRAERGIGDQKEKIDLNELFKMLYDNYHAQAKEKNLQFNLDIPAKLPPVMQSRLYLEEMLQNFITNAIKYTTEGSVTVHARLTKQGVECVVSDTGIGISKSDQKKIFQKFYRSEDYRTRETGGTGLGLYVVRKLADKMGVHINVESRLNHGSRFGFVMSVTKDNTTLE